MASLMVMDKSNPNGGMYSSGHRIGYLELLDNTQVVKLYLGLGIVDGNTQHNFDLEGYYVGSINI